MRGGERRRIESLRDTVGGERGEGRDKDRDRDRDRNKDRDRVERECARGRFIIGGAAKQER